MLTLEKSNGIFNKLENNFPINLTGGIDWNEFDGDVSTEGISYIYRNVNLQNKYYILWDNQAIPCVICDLYSILKCIDDVLAVSFNTWLLSMEGTEVVEFYHEGDITYGRLE